MRCAFSLNAAIAFLGLSAVTVPAEAAPPAIVEQPRSQIAGSGETVRFSVVADGDPPLSYQWRFNGTPLANATNATLTLSNVEPSQAGIYSVFVANPAGSNVSCEASLEVCWEVQLTALDRISLSNAPFATLSIFDSDGNLYLAQPFVDQIGFTVAKFTLKGEQTWTVPFHATNGFRYLRIRGLAVDCSGSVALVGVTATSFYSDLEDTLLWKLDSGGLPVWSTRYASAGFPHAIAVDVAGDIYVAGTTSEGFNSHGGAKPAGDIETVKFSAAGQRLWAATYGGPEGAYDEPGALAADASGNIYVAGVSNPYDFSSELVIAKYDDAGNSLWVTRQPTNQMYAPHSVLVDGEGNIVVGLSFWHGAPFDTHATLKYTADGNLLWGIGHSVFTEIEATGARVLDQFNNIYFAIVRDYPRAFTCTKYDPNGRLLWSVTPVPNGQFSFSSYGGSLKIDRDQNVLFAGQSDAGVLGLLCYRQNTVTGRPVIHGVPPGRRVASGTVVTFNLAVTGATPLYYQWRRDRMSLPGATDALLVLSNVTTADSGGYSLLVTNAVGCSVSAVGSLTVVDVQPFHFELFAATPSTVTFRLMGEANRLYWFEVSANLTEWLLLFGTISSSSVRDLVISNHGESWRFFRAWTDP